MPVDLYYYILSPPSRAVMILAKQLGIELNLINVDLSNGDQGTEEFQKINPCRAIPAMKDNGFVLAESRAVLTYLINQYSPGHELYPTDPKKRAKIDRVLYLTAEIFERWKTAVIPVYTENKWPMDEDKVNSYLELVKVLEQVKNGDKFLAGDTMTIADISFICDLTIATDVFSVDISNVAPGIVGWMERMKTELKEYDELIGKVAETFLEMIRKKYQR